MVRVIIEGMGSYKREEMKGAIESRVDLPDKSMAASSQQDGSPGGVPHLILYRKPPGPWTELETNHLIDAYQEKWYALKRGQLKARHWEEVANLVALRCGGVEPTKSSVQCRHKVEKLRKRYRTEKQQELSRGSGSSKWVFFERMDLLENGPPQARPDSGAAPEGRHSAEQDSDTTDTANNPRAFRPLSEKGSYQAGLPSDNDTPLHPRAVMNGDSESNARFAKISSLFRSSVKRRKSVDDPQPPSRPQLQPQPLSQPQPQPQPQPLSELASVVRALGEGFMRIEQMKIEMQRDSERLRMEMEMKRTEMILQSQQHIADAISKAFSSKKKAKKLQSLDA